jgi:uncharacterized protein (DUF2147 family)
MVFLTLIVSNRTTVLMKKFGLFLIVFFIFSLHLAAQEASIVGVWKSVDDQSKDVRVHIQIYEFEGRKYGKIIKLFKSPSGMRCSICPGDLKDQPILGMVVVEKLQLVNGFYKNGKILDPQDGKWYSCQMWLKDGDPNVLVVRGFLGFLYRTQNWYRVE